MQIILTNEELAEAAIKFAASQIALREGQQIEARIETTEDGGAIAIVEIGIKARAEAQPEQAQTRTRKPRQIQAQTAKDEPGEAMTAADGSKGEEPVKEAQAQPQEESKPILVDPTTVDSGAKDKDDVLDVADAPARPSIFASPESSAPPASQGNNAPAPLGKSLFANLVKPKHDDAKG